VLEGQIEFFGMRLLPLKSYFWESGSLFTWYNCKNIVRIIGKTKFHYVERKGEDDFMKQLTWIHAGSQFFRNQLTTTKGPVIFICGQQDTGKATATLILLNQMLRCGLEPYHIDLNSNFNKLSQFPNSIAMKQLSYSHDFEPIVYFVGDPSNET